MLPGAINTPFTQASCLDLRVAVAITSGHTWHCPPHTHVCPASQAILNSPEKLAYMKERIPLGRLGEPEDIVGELQATVSCKLTCVPQGCTLHCHKDAWSLLHDTTWRVLLSLQQAQWSSSARGQPTTSQVCRAPWPGLVHSLILIH